MILSVNGEEEEGINLLGKCSAIAKMCQVSLELYVHSKQDLHPMTAILLVQALGTVESWLLLGGNFGF